MRVRLLALFLSLLFGSGAVEDTILEGAIFSLPGSSEAASARGWATSGPEARLEPFGVVVDSAPGSWHFIAPRHLVELGPTLYGFSISFSIQYSAACHVLNSTRRARIGQVSVRDESQKSSTASRPPRESAQLHDSTGHDMVLSGAGALLAAKAGPALAGMAVKIHETWDWTDLDTGKRVDKQALSRVLSALDALLLRPRRCDHPGSGHLRTVLQQFVVSTMVDVGSPSKEKVCSSCKSNTPSTPSRESLASVGNVMGMGGQGEGIRGGDESKGSDVDEDRDAHSGTRVIDLHDCDAMYKNRDWPRSLQCYLSALPDLMEENHRPTSSAASQGGAREWGVERVCWAQLRALRLRLMLSKHPVAQTLRALDRLEKLTLEESVRYTSDRWRSGLQNDGEERARQVGFGGGVEVGSCMAWVLKTRGDALFRDRQYEHAAEAYRRALSHEVGDVAVTAILHSDLGAAAHLAGHGTGSQAHYHQNVGVHYARAAQLLPSVIAHQILGTLGTYSFGERARVEIQARLAELAKTKTQPTAAAGAPEAWYARLESFLQQRRQGHGHLYTKSSCQRTVFFFCRLRGQTPGTADQSWGPSSVVRGLGGSEEAALYVSRELSKRGYCVRVYGNPNPEEYGADEHGVEWLPFWAFQLAESPDVAVLWRNFDSVWLAPRAARRYLWVHDPLALASDQDYFTADFLSQLSAIFVLSNHSKSQFPPHAQAKLFLSTNGLAEHLLRDGNNSHQQLLYASWPSSGLEEVLKQWAHIRKGAPEAELHVYGGFDWWWATPLYKDEPWFIEWRAEMEGLLQQDGVKYWGGVGHEVMAVAYAQAGFYVYPTDTPETAPINLMKAQANGCIPVTSRFLGSAIPETTGLFDLGPPPRAGSIKQDPAWLAEWTAAVIQAVNTPRSQLAAHRRRMKQVARVACCARG